MSKRQPNLPGYPQSEADMVSEALRRPLEEKIASAVGLLQLYEAKALELSPDGYWLAYSGGKDSECILELARMAGVKHRAVYNVTTIDPPELVRFIKREHPEVRFLHPARPLLHVLTEKRWGPPTKSIRWCCRIFKETGGAGTAKVIGVRIAESPSRAKLWRAMVPERDGDGLRVCPIVYWTTEDVWAFHRLRNLPHCGLYDEGFTRLGCVGCPLASKRERAKAFERWPRFRLLWRRAFQQFWDKWADVPNNRGEDRWFIRCGVKSAEELWQWWLTDKREPRGTCQGDELFAKTERHGDE